MTGFVVAAALLAAVGLGWLLWPLRRREPSAEVPGAEQGTVTLEILRAQLAELDAERAAGRIDASQHAQATEELQRRVLEEQVPAAQAAVQGVPGRARMTAAVIVIVMPLAAALLYWQLGAPAAIDLVAHGGAPQEAMSPERIEDLVRQLAERMEREPGNAEGWALLARSYYAMERFSDAARAYEKLLALQPQDADAMADLADALAMVAGRRISGRSLDLVRSALALNPTQWKALAMAGTEAFERKDYRGAVDYWERLRGSVPADSQLAQSIGTSIDEARRLGGLAAAAPAPAIAATAPTAPPGSTAAAPATGATTPAPPASATAAAAAVSGELRLAPTLAQQVAPGDTVFVTARAAEGPRIPLAVKRLQVKDLPTAFRLDDSLAMAPNMKISAFPDVVITARVSRSGQATPQSGDLESTPLPTKNAASGLIVIIDRVVP